MKGYYEFEEFIGIKVSTKLKADLKRTIKELRSKQLISEGTSISSIVRNLVKTWIEYQKAKLKELEQTVDGGK